MRMLTMQSVQKAQGLHRRSFRPMLKAAWLFCIASLLSFAVCAQNITVKGKVIDDKGGPIAGASVTVKTNATGGDNTGAGTGTSTGTSTSATGDFTITVARNATLIFSAAGLVSKEVPVNGKTTINVALNTSTTDLDQVVVVGYGTQRKEAVTGSVASIGGEKLRDVPTANISQALQGRLAGVDISQTSTRPGATTQIRIRGDRSLTGDNNPLIVLDGIPFIGSLGDINPNDVKSIDVLKDASATAIYGSRGANGVILVTTNRGQKGQKARFSYNSYTGLQNIFSRFPMMNSSEYVALRNYAGYVTKPGLDEDTTANPVNTDWQKLLFRTGVVTDHSISMVAGSQQGSYSFGLGYYQNQGVIPTQRYTRYSMKASVDQQVGNYFRIGLTSNSNYNRSEGNQIGLYNNLALTPIANPYNSDGSLKRIVQLSQDNFYPLTKDRIDSLQDKGTFLNETRGFATYNSIYGEVSIPGIKGLKYRLNVGADYTLSNGGNFTGANVNSTTIGSVSGAGISSSQTFHWTLENILSYDRSFGKHNINFVGLYSAEQNTFNSSSFSATDIGTDNFQFYNLASALPNNITVNQGAYQQSGLMSGMGRLIYSFDNRYLLSATLRSDGSSRLAPGNKWHTYPAVSIGWNIANESFMQGISAINSLKLRAGFGQTSNQAIAPYSTLGTLSARNYNFGPTTYSFGYYVTRAPNPALGWEYSKTINLGLDFGLFRNRLSGTLEYYSTKTEGLLQDLSLPPTAGVSVVTQNVGKTQNKGIELTLNGTILNNVGGFTWDAGFNISFNRNKLTYLADGATRNEANNWFVGYNINTIFDYQKIGLWQANDPYRSILQPGDSAQTVGSIKVLYTGGYGANGEPLRAINANDRQVMNVNPDFTGGFNTRVSYKGFDLSTVGLFKSGGVLISTLYGSAGYLNRETGRVNNIKIDYWTPTNTGAKYPRPGKSIDGDNPRYQSTNSYFDASFLKIRTIQLGYDFNQSILKNSSIKLRMYATVQNPFVLFSPYHKESGMDPETNSYGNENAAVNLSANLRRLLTVGFNTPALRSYILGINLTF